MCKGVKELTDIKNDNTKIIYENSELKVELENLNKKIETLHQPTTINNNIQNNTLNNNIILAHGAEDLGKIDLETIMGHLATINFREIIPNLTKHIFINDDKPENKNFCVLDMSRNKCKYWNGKKWIIGNSKPMVNKIFDKVQNVLTEQFEKDKLTKTIEFIKSNNKFKHKEKFINYSKIYLNNLYDDTDKENIQNKEEIINELKTIFYNNREEILKIIL
jgi:hypothetical protein